MASVSPAGEFKATEAAGGHYGWLDACRFLAALIVVLTHVRGFLFVQYDALDNHGALSAAFYALTKLGHEAVIVFFVLSGYLVGGKAIERLIGGRFNPADYAIDRISRIWIPLLPALILSALLSGVENSAFVWAGNFVGLQRVIVPELAGNGPLWSLAYEIWFYVLIYAIGRQAARSEFDAVSMVLLAGVALVFTKLEIQYMMCWFVGALFYIRPHRHSSVWGGLFSVVLVLVAVAALQLTGEGQMARAKLPPGGRAVFEIALAAGFGYGLVVLTKVPSNRVSMLASRLAAFSYTLYLTHYPILLWIRRQGWFEFSHLGLMEMGAFFGVAVLCLLCAWILYLPFERNTGRIRAVFKSQQVSK